MLAMVPFLVVTLFSSIATAKDLTQTSNHLVSFATSKKNQLEDYFGNLKEQIINFSQQDFAGNSIGRFLSGFTGAFENSGTTPQEAPRPCSWAAMCRAPGTSCNNPTARWNEPSISALILADEMYGQVHQRFHRGYAADMVRKSNYSDIFLVDLSGDVVYSVTKHANFAQPALRPLSVERLWQHLRQIKAAPRRRPESRSRSSSSPILAATS